MKAKASTANNKKTELCLRYPKGECKFGLKCSYAHGEHELQKKLYADTDGVNTLEDAAHYRGYLCFDHVSTGACPYVGNRCGHNHDPRIVAGKDEVKAAFETKFCSPIEYKINGKPTGLEFLWDI